MKIFDVFKLITFLVFITAPYICNSDAPKFWQLGFQDAATPVMEGIVNFHNHTMFFIVGITALVCWLLFRSLTLYTYKRNLKNSLYNYESSFTHSKLLEIVWTLLPAFILILIAIPSFALLYSMEELVQPTLTLKIVGHQWYWSYEYGDIHQFEDPSFELFNLSEDSKGEAYVNKLKHSNGKEVYYNNAKAEQLAFDSYMIGEEDLQKGSLRLLEVDKRVVLPEKTHIRLLVTAADVLHSWAVPSFGLKVDACPGRLNQSSLYIKRQGLYYGQCSEICGVNHGFMPIVVKVMSKNDFKLWQIAKITNF